MNCHVCGQQQTDAEAAFCGQCGVALRRSLPPCTFTPSASLSDAIHQLVKLFEGERLGLSQAALELQAWADTGRCGERPTIAIIGDCRRGKSTVLNRLLGQEAVATRCLSASSILHVQQHPQGTPTGDAEEFFSDAALLQCVDLVDTPPLASRDTGEVPDAIRVALRATGIVFCLDARQVLSAVERRILLAELLPLTHCPIVLAVTFLDQVPDPIDRQEIQELLLRFVDSNGENRLSVMMLEPGQNALDPLPGLDSWIRAVAAQPNDKIDPRQRMWDLLTCLENALPDADSPQRDASGKQRARALQVLDREHQRSLRHTSSLFRERCSYLRGDLKAILRASSMDTHGRSAMSHVVQQLRRLLQECGEAYLRELQGALQDGGPLMLRTTSQSIDTTAVLDIQAPSLAAPDVPSSRQRSLYATALEAGSLAAVVAIPGLISVLGVTVSLVAAQSIRQNQRQQQAGQQRLDTELSLQTWLAAAEPKLIDALSEATDKVIEEIRQQVARCFAIEPNDTQESIVGSTLRQAIGHCRNLLQTKAAEEPSTDD